MLENAGRNSIIFGLKLMLLISASVTAALAQTTAFTYQGKITENNQAAADKLYDFEFRLFDAPENGNKFGSTVQLLGVPVKNGAFSVQLDFGAQFNGEPRFLEIAVKSAPGPFATLMPRQPLNSTPYATHAATAATATNALQVGGTPAANIVRTNDPRLTDARNPLPSSANYIQNTTAQQASSNFNISGNGTVGETLNTKNLFVGGFFEGHLRIYSTNVFPATLPERDIGGSALHVSNGSIYNSFSIASTSNRQPRVGEYWKDNSIIAWAKVAANGSLMHEYGVVQVIKDGVGNYRIRLKADACCQSVPIATAEVEALPTTAAMARLVTIDQIEPKEFRVYITNGTYAPVDNDFVVIVTGR